MCVYADIYFHANSGHVMLMCIYVCIVSLKVHISDFLKFAFSCMGNHELNNV